MQDGLQHGLQPSALAHDLVAPRHLSAQRQRRLVRYPNFGQEAAHAEPGQDSGVDDIRFDPGFGDQPDLTRISNHHSTDMLGRHLGNRRGVAGRLDDDVVILRRGLAERHQERASCRSGCCIPGPLSRAGFDRGQVVRFWPLNGRR
jgi:hypothetical protein